MLQDIEVVRWSRDIMLISDLSTSVSSLLSSELATQSTVTQALQAAISSGQGIANNQSASMTAQASSALYSTTSTLTVSESTAAAYAASLTTSQSSMQVRASWCMKYCVMSNMLAVDKYI